MPSQPPTSIECATAGGDAAARAWTLIACAARAVRGAIDLDSPADFALVADALREVPRDHPDAQLRWEPESGWVRPAGASDPDGDLLDLYLPICSAYDRRPITIGHLGQSLDGFIATLSGDSQFVTGPENIVHLHRMRALCDAVVVGAGTVAADDPRLTTRLVPGENPLRVVIDPSCRLADVHRVFTDGEARTLRACGPSNGAAAPERHEERLEVRMRDGRLDLADLVAQLRERGCARIFVEGGGVTVSAFLAARLLDRLHVTVAPLLIGAGRPAIRMDATSRLSECLRPRRRVFRMGEDVLFDCELAHERGAQAADSGAPSVLTPVQRIL